MKDEIKEIIQLIGNCCYRGEISEDKCEKYCNCITNLQEEIERLNNTINKLEKELDRGYRDLFDMELVNGRELIINIKNYIDELKENNKDIYIEERYDSED